MFKSKILTILYILCFLVLNVNAYADENTKSESSEIVTESVSEDKTEEKTVTDAASGEDTEEEKPSTDETTESPADEEDEEAEPDCD